jgi:hypothetical protein
MGLKFGAALLGIVGLYFLNSTHALFPVPPLHEGAVPRDDEAEPDLLIWPPIPEKTMAVVKGKGVAVDLFAWFHRAPKFAGNHWYATPVPTVGTNAPPDSSATRTPRTDQAGSFEADRRTGRCSAADDGVASFSQEGGVRAPPLVAARGGPAQAHRHPRRWPYSSGEGARTVKPQAANPLKPQACWTDKLVDRLVGARSGYGELVVPATFIDHHNHASRLEYISLVREVLFASHSP